MLFLYTLEKCYLTLERDFDQMSLKLNDINKAKNRQAELHAKFYSDVKGENPSWQVSGEIH